MTAYGAIISLQNTIQHIVCASHISLVHPSLQILQPAYEELQPLQEILESLDTTTKSRSRKKVNALDGRIKDLIWEFEDSLESLLTDQILSQQLELASNIGRKRRRRTSHLSILGVWLRRKSNTRGTVNKSHASQYSSSRVEGKRDLLLFSIDLQRLQINVRSFIKTLKDMKKEYIYELGNMPKEDEDESIPSGIGFCGTNSKMIGLTDQLEQVISRLIQRYDRALVYALVGMAGVGKTTLAKEIFQDPAILSYFECRTWVTVGRNPQRLHQLSLDILAQLYGDKKKGDCLKGKKCLIVVDDVWETEVLNYLIVSLSNIKNGYIQFLVTARDRSVITFSMGSYIKVVRFLNEEESKDLLCEKVFGDEICPPQLVKAAAKIAKHCEGLPLLIVTVAHHLSQTQNRDSEYWNDVAAERNSVFKDAYNEISKVLFPSYDYLPQNLKMPFLFMGVFPSYYDTPPSKLINMLAAEGWFLDTNRNMSLDESVWDCLDELSFYKNLVLFNKKSNFWHGILHHRVYKTCRLHSTWRHVCRGEARKNKFYHVLSRLVDGLEEDVRGQRCLCLQNNILFGIKEFCNSVRLNCAFSTRSVFYFGPYHQYPIPINVGFRFLRELDALKLRFYSFPNEILTLIQLKYLALTCNGELPTTISKLFNLHVLIVHPHMNIRCCRAPLFVPIQIWDMQELEHIEILGKSLVAPFHVASLENLSTLVGVNASICTILELSTRIPNIRKLGVQIELMPYDDHNDLLSCFGCISTLGSLETLKCSIINPVVQYGYVVPATPSLMLPHGLKKLHLSGMGFPWEYMDVIGSLRFLQVLKLRSYAFLGSKWEAQVRTFRSLEFLLIEDSDLVQWKPSNGSFPKLSYLSMKHCYKLEEIHWPSLTMLGKIELVDCHPLALNCAKKLQPSRGTHLDVTASSSFGEKPMTIKHQSYGVAKEEEFDSGHMSTAEADTAFSSHLDTTFPDHMVTAFSSHLATMSIVEPHTGFSSHLFIISLLVFVLLGFRLKIL